jgi:uncharacterized membrane protein YebE (DUF533 family)
MSLVGTLAKVAIGVAIAKGVGNMMQQGSAGAATPKPRSAGTGGLFGAENSPRTANAGSSGGLEEIMKSVLGGAPANAGTTGRAAGGAAAGGAAGGLGGLLEQLAGAGGTGTAAQGGIGGLLEQLAGGKTGTAGAGGAGGLGDLLGQLTGQMGGQPGTSTSSAGAGAGGLGDLLGGLLGGAAAGGAASNGKSFGDILNASLQNGGEPPVPPTPTQEAAAALLLRAMIQAAKSDGSIDAAEKAKIMQNLKDATPAEIKFVNALVAAPVDVQALVRDVPRGLGPQVYTMSVMAIDLDNQKEANYLHALAQGLGINQQQVNAIHAQLGVPALYT